MIVADSANAFVMTFHCCAHCGTGDHWHRTHQANEHVLQCPRCQVSTQGNGILGELITLRRMREDMLADAVELKRLRECVEEFRSVTRYPESSKRQDRVKEFVSDVLTAHGLMQPL